MSSDNALNTLAMKASGIDMWQVVTAAGGLVSCAYGSTTGVSPVAHDVRNMTQSQRVTEAQS